MINCLIVDDEPVALDILENYVSKTPFLSLKGRCNGAVEALKYLNGEDIDLVFLDIQMPEINGMEFSKMISEKVKVIFTTAFEQYALEGFKVNALDYLLKPFSYPEFLKAAAKAKNWFDLHERANQPAAEQRKENSLFVRSEYKLIKIEFKDILYIEGMKDYAKFFLASQDKPVFSLMSLKLLEEKLPRDQFMRVHRSFIVNMDNIRTIERNEIIFGKVSIPVADKFREQFHDFIRTKFLGS